MQIDFEWHTKTLDSAKKESLEKLIKLKISSVVKNCFDKEVPPLIVSLLEEESPAYKVVRGTASTVESGEKKIVIELEIDQGFFIKCNKFGWFEPRGKL